MMMKTLVSAAIAAVCFAGLASSDVSAAQSFIADGSFEAPNRKGGWSVYTSVGQWFTVSGAGIEIQTDGVGRNSTPFGTHWVELDSHNRGLTGDSNTNTAMGQVVNLGAGDYTLTFHFMPRTNRSDDNGIVASIFGWDADNSVPEGTALEELIILDQKRRDHGSWAEYSLAFSIIEDTDYLVQFRATGRQNTLGGFIDNVALTLAAPEPATWLMMLSGFAMVGNGLQRRRRMALPA